MTREKSLRSLPVGARGAPPVGLASIDDDIDETAWKAFQAGIYGAKPIVLWHMLADAAAGRGVVRHAVGDEPVSGLFPDNPCSTTSSDVLPILGDFGDKPKGPSALG